MATAFTEPVNTSPDSRDFNLSVYFEAYIKAVETAIAPDMLMGTSIDRLFEAIG